MEEKKIIIKKTGRASKTGFRKPGQVFTMKAAIRTHCIMCMGGDSSNTPTKEIRDCTMKKCPLYTYRLGGIDMDGVVEEIKNKEVF